jgi:hypothetical protein
LVKVLAVAVPPLATVPMTTAPVAAAIEKVTSPFVEPFASARSPKMVAPVFEIVRVELVPVWMSGWVKVRFCVPTMPDEPENETGRVTVRAAALASREPPVRLIWGAPASARALAIWRVPPLTVIAPVAPLWSPVSVRMPLETVVGPS